MSQQLLPIEWRVVQISEDDGDIDNFFSKMRSKSPVKVKKVKAPKILDDIEDSPDSSPSCSRHHSSFPQHCTWTSHFMEYPFYARAGVTLVVSRIG